ncbi:hypothetical protein NG726_27615 [Pseudomonas sp. MOB-449]|nr:hypothetical protein [Pseudomonas sp. MOB-449]
MRQKSKTASRNPMTTEAMARIHSAEAIANDGQVTKDSFTARAARAAEKNKR